MGIRSWHRGMSFSFILYLSGHHQEFRIGGGHEDYRTWHRGMSFRFILPLRRHQVIGKYAGLYKGAPGDAGSAARCKEMRGDTRSLEEIRGDTRRCEEIRGWQRGLSFRFTFVLRTLRIIGRDKRRYQGVTRRCEDVQEDARRCEVI